ncbi:unnamed protein product [Mucor hiemalis]
MRAFSSIFIAAIFALTANAAAIEKRIVSTPVQTCIDDMVFTASQLDVVTNLVNGFTSAGGYGGASAIHTQEQELEKRLKKAGTSCCATPPTTVTTDEADAVLGVVATLVPKITGSLTAIVSKKPQFDAILLATLLVKGDIKNLDAQTKTLYTCLVNKTPASPPSYLITANGYVSQIQAGFANAKTAYGI